MRVLILFFAVVVSCLAQTWDKGFNFRSTSGFTTDDTGQTYVLATDTSPTTRNGVTFQWTGTAPSAADRNAGTDPRLAGINFAVNASGKTTAFCVTLDPAFQTYSIHLALGDYNFAQTNMVAKLKDNGSVWQTIGPLTTSAGQRWFDATGTEYNATTWPTNEQPITHTFSSTGGATDLCLNIGDNPASSGQNTTISHLRIVSVDGASGPSTRTTGGVRLTGGARIQ